MAQPISITFQSGDTVTATCEEWVLGLIYVLGEVETAKLVEYLKSRNAGTFTTKLAGGA